MPSFFFYIFLHAFQLPFHLYQLDLDNGAKKPQGGGIFCCKHSVSFNKLCNKKTKKKPDTIFSKQLRDHSKMTPQG